MRNRNKFSDMLPFRFGGTLMSVAMILLGLFLAFRPKKATDLLFLIAGIVLTGYGLYSIVCTFFGTKRRISIPEIGSGISALAFGLLCLVFKHNLLSFGPYLIGIGLLFSGITKVSIARSLGTRRPFGLFTGCLSIIMGIVLIARPFSTVWMLTRAVGVIMVIESIQNLLVAQTYNGIIETKFND